MDNLKNKIQVIKEWTPNHYTGRKGTPIKAIVLHVTGGSFYSADQWIKDPKSQVSYHYIIEKNGNVHQYVDDTDTAWHSGVVHKPKWAGLIKGENPNFYTIGIAFEGKKRNSITLEQVISAATLLAFLSKKHKIKIKKSQIITHKQINSQKPDIHKTHKIDLIIQLADLIKKSQN